MDDDPKILTLPLLFGFTGLVVSWLIIGFFISALILAIVSIAIGIISFGLGYLVMTIRDRKAKRRSETSGESHPADVPRSNLP